MNNCTASQEKFLNLVVLYCLFGMQTLDIIYQYIYTRVRHKGNVPVLLFKVVWIFMDLLVMTSINTL